MKELKFSKIANIYWTLASLVAQRLKCLPPMRETWVQIPGSGRSPGEGNGNPLQYSCLENPMDWGAWWVAVHGVTKSRTRLSDFTLLYNVPANYHFLLIPFWVLTEWHIFSQFSSVAQSCPALYDPMSCSMPGLTVHHQLQWVRKIPQRAAW